MSEKQSVQQKNTQKKEINSITINYTYRYMIIWLNIKISHVHNGVKNNHKNSLQ